PTPPATHCRPSSSTSGRWGTRSKPSSSSGGGWRARERPGGCAPPVRRWPRGNSGHRARCRWTRRSSRSYRNREPCCTSWSAEPSNRSTCRLSNRGRTSQVRKESTRMSDEPRLEELHRLISMGKQKGYLTYDEVHDALPSDIVSLDQLDDIMMMFGAMDIEVVDSATQGRLPSEVRAAQPQADDDDGDGPEPIDLTPGPVGRTEDPVRLYLREMGRVALLTREGEIALAKRIEEGKNQVTNAILSTNLA